MTFSVTVNPLDNGVKHFMKATLPIRWHWFTLPAVQACIQSSQLPTQAHWLHHLTSRTWYSDTVTSYTKTSVLLKLINLTFAEIFTSPAKI